MIQDSAGVDDFDVVIIFIPIIVVIITLVSDLGQLLLVVIIPHELNSLRLLGG